MKKIEAQTLQDALILAATEFECSVVDLEYEIIQSPSKGFLGFGKKRAIICVQTKKVESKTKVDFLQVKEEYCCDGGYEIEPNSLLRKQESILQNKQYNKKEKKFEFSLEELQEIANSVAKELNELLEMLPYELEVVIVEPYNKNTLYIKIDGEDSPLLIGKDGYRYKAISYLIFNWVNHIYGLMIRLEIAEFLRNQEEMIANYLLPTIENVKLNGKAQTKPLDGVLAHIALKQLRAQFPDKYVSFRCNSEGKRYIVIQAFHH